MKNDRNNEHTKKNQKSNTSSIKKKQNSGKEHLGKNEEDNEPKMTRIKRKRSESPKQNKKRKLNPESDSTDTSISDSDNSTKGKKPSTKKYKSNKEKSKDKLKESVDKISLAKTKEKPPEPTYHESHTKPKKEGYDKNDYVFTLDKNIQKAIKTRTDDITSYSERHNYHSNSEENSISDEEHSDTERLKHSDLLMVPRINLGVEHYKQDKSYELGKTNGEIYTFTREGVKFGARLDSVDSKFNIRTGIFQKDAEVIRKGKKVRKDVVKDKTTKKLAEFLDDQTETYTKYFIKALKGGKRGKVSGNKKNEAYQAFTDGLETRMVLLTSDALHYPGNSVITEKMINNVNQDNYKHLFLGDKNEGSYGSVPNQNINSEIENKERSKVYNTVGNFFQTGHYHGKLKNKTELPLMRKFRSMTQNLKDEDFVSIQNNKKKVSISDFEGLTLQNHQQIKTDAIQKKIKRIDPKGSHVSEEEDSEIEQEKVRIMPKENREARKKNLLETQEVVKKKLQYLENVDMDRDSSKDESQDQYFEDSSDNEDNSTDEKDKYSDLDNEGFEKLQRDTQKQKDKFDRRLRLIQEVSQARRDKIEQIIAKETSYYRREHYIPEEIIEGKVNEIQKKNPHITPEKFQKVIKEELEALAALGDKVSQLAKEFHQGASAPLLWEKAIESSQKPSSRQSWMQSKQNVDSLTKSDEDSNDRDSNRSFDMSV
jgi:hypothetical protein